MLSKLKIKKLQFTDILFVITLIIYAFFGYSRIGKASINNDAQFWYTRTQNFIDAVQEKRWGETLQNPKPGITVHWLSGLSLETFLSLYEKIYHFRPDIYTYDTFHLVHFSVIAPLITVNVVFIAVFYFLCSKIFSKEISLLGVILFSMQPFYVGISRNFHSDSILAAFMTLSSIILIYYLNKKPIVKYAIFSGVFAGLALLSKSSAVFLLPYISLLLLLDFAFNRRPLKFYISSFLLWLITCSITFFILLPDMWIEPAQNLKEIFIYEGYFLATTGRDGINNFFYYIEPILRVTTPILLMCFLTSILYFIVNRKEFRLKKETSIFYIFCYTFFYLLQISITKQKMDRYLLPVFPFIALLSGYGIINFIDKHLKTHKYNIFLLLFIANFIFILSYYPNYLIYPSQKGKDQFGCSLCSDIGEYLNNKPNASDLKVISLSDKVHRIKPFVKGKVYTIHEILPAGWTAEYLIAAKDETLPNEYQHCIIEKTISFKGVEYWDIYRCK
ncbi:glycosyltransferase family 39 protein [Patescibacteria group bacterium]|nr:glycosyltransferase family 39 protein [Patescibacteria group bacterium]